jgi:hypothetical protein
MMRAEKRSDRIHRMFQDLQNMPSAFWNPRPPVNAACPVHPGSFFSVEI